MCGRYILRKATVGVQGLAMAHLLAPCWNARERFNVALTQRMPVILDETNTERWLGDTRLSNDVLERLCSPCPAEKMEPLVLGHRINHARHNRPDSVAAEGRLS